MLGIYLQTKTSFMCNYINHVSDCDMYSLILFQVINWRVNPEVRGCHELTLKRAKKNFPLHVRDLTGQFLNLDPLSIQ